MLRQAWTALEALHPQPADANGDVRGWDRVWERRLSTAAGYRCASIPFADRTCHYAEISVLMCTGASISLDHARTEIFREPVPRAADTLDVYVAIADEAARRAAAGLSCEDLPDAANVTRDSSGEWVIHGSEYLTPRVSQPTRTAPQTMPPEDPTVCGSMEGTQEAVPEASQRRFEANLPRIRACLAQAPEAPRGVLAVVISRDGERRAIDLAGPCALTTGEMAACLRDAVRDVAVEDYEQLRWWMTF